MVPVFRSGGLRAIIFVDDREPAQVHVFGDGHAKIDLLPEPRLVWAEGMTRGELRKAMAVVSAERDRLLARWRDIHG